jgi:radical SAM protein with 4Fe4S-binding SPASM domain
MAEHSPFPQQLVIELTAGCNQACIFCGRTYMPRPKKTMTLEMYKRIIDEVAAESPYTEVWPTFMGEAMLLGDMLFEALRYAKNKGLQKVTLNSNGTRLTSDNIQKLVDTGLDRFIISCDAHTPETHARVRPPINPKSKHQGLDLVYRGIHELLEVINQRGLQYPMVELQFSIFDENEHEVEDFKRYWLAQGVTVKVRPKLYWSGLVDGGDHRVTFEGRTPCMWARDSAGIHWNGNVVMCPVDCNGNYVAGNIEMQSLKDIWNGPLKWMRELQFQGRYQELPQICRECPDWRVKKAHAYYPNAEIQALYERYVNLGRTYTESHFWSEQEEVIR